MADTIVKQCRDKFVTIIEGIGGDLGFDSESGNVRDKMLEDFELEVWGKKLSAKVNGVNEPRLWCVDAGRIREYSQTDQCFLDTIAIRVKGYYRFRKRQDMIDGMDKIIDEVFAGGHAPTFGGLVSRLVDHTQPSEDELTVNVERAGKIITIQSDFVLERQTES